MTDLSWVEPQEYVNEDIKRKHYRQIYVWANCLECDQEVWIEPRQQFYHKLACPHSNGIGYGEERRNNPTLPHHHQCECLRCKAK